MKRSARNIGLGVVLAVILVGAALLIIALTKGGGAAEKMKEAMAIRNKAEAVWEEAAGLEAAGNEAAAQSKRDEAQSLAIQSIDILRKLHDDSSIDKSIRLSAAYQIGLQEYAYWSEPDPRVKDGIKLLQEVINEGAAPMERFEACRVVALWCWDRGDTEGVRDIFAGIQQDKAVLRTLNSMLARIQGSPDGQDDLDFFKDHPALGISAEELLEYTFTPQDVTYWNRSLFYDAQAKRIAGDETGASAVRRLFDWCVRNVVTLAEDEGRTTATPPYQRMLAGHGTATERAWVFATLLQALWRYPSGKDMLYYEAVIISAGKSTIVCAWDGKTTHLYDMDLCIPVYKADGKTEATLAELRVAADVPLNTGIAGVSYPYKSADIRNAAYYVFFNPLSACFREALVLPNAYAVEPLVHRTERPYRPLYESVIAKYETVARRYFSHKVKSIGYPYNDPDGGTLALWQTPFAERRDAVLYGTLKKEGETSPQLKILSDAEKQELAAYVAAYDSTESRIKALSQGRALQLIGRYAEAAEWYKSHIIDTKDQDPGVVEDAHYWRAVALAEITPATVQDAEDALNAYLAAYPWGRWKNSVLFRVGILYQQAGEKDKAAECLNKVRGSLVCPAKRALNT